MCGQAGIPPFCHLMNLDDDPEGKKVLEIVKFFFKEQRNFHVVVTATSSVHVRRFLRDIDRRAEVIVIGRKSFGRSKMYPSTPLPPVGFSDVYRVMGGGICTILWN